MLRVCADRFVFLEFKLDLLDTTRVAALTHEAELVDGRRRPGLAKSRENEERFAAANAQINQKAESLQMNDELIPFLCECSELECTQIIRLSLADFQAARAQTGTFILLADHDDASVERIIEQTDGYLLVEKFRTQS